jgi:hypothetical protein
VVVTDSFAILVMVLGALGLLGFLAWLGSGK